MNVRLLGLTSISIAAVVVQLCAMSTGYSIFPWRIPISWGFIKDVLDIPIVFLFGWGGWPAFFIFLTGSILGISAGTRVILCLTASLACGIAQTMHSYEILSTPHFMSGIITSFLIYGASIAIAVPIEIIASKILRRKACQSQ